ncbi:hypothetical protein TA3x_003100 [Tundrisphaera sp. TA3]|uniref:hypothetical protein n=1 Tax=Tundrisphaera sp. TA3 TaxID=3435775 RepID=UPI003EC0FC2F
MPPPPDRDDPALAFVHQGWDHLKQQRPVAAWASWRRALRIDPENKAASQALDVLAAAGDLPRAARVEYRFSQPDGDERRARWDRRLRGEDLEDLAVAAGAFADLAEADPSDGGARLNQAYCLAWIGRNVEAIAALDLAVRALAEPEAATRAWTLAEVLRQGGGAETLADDLNHNLTLTWVGGTDPAGFLDERPEVRLLPSPVDPSVGTSPLPEARVYEWLDGPPTYGPAGQARRVLSRLVRTPRMLRLSSPDPVGLEIVAEAVLGMVRDRVESARREATPLPLTFLDAAIWAIRPPAAIDPGEEARFHREAVERFYEGAWLRTPRHGLDGRSPIEAGRLASGGDPVARAKLEAVVGFREQLGERPTTAALYQGYPFDRLRRRLGLSMPDPAVVDPLDPTSMSGEELDKLDPATLGDVPLADAYESAAALGDDRRTSRFAAPLAERDPSALARLDIPALFATLVRAHLADEDPDGALARLDRADVIDRELHQGRDRRTFATWRAEVLARVGRPEAALQAYNRMFELAPESEAALAAFDAAETMLDNGHDAEAGRLARRARRLARRAGDVALAERAELLIPAGEEDLIDE